MQTVTRKDQVTLNIEEMEATRRAGSSSKFFAYYRGLIARGHCFVPYSVEGVLHFAPSRFVGYEGITFARHKAAEVLDGKLTNPARSKALGIHLVEDLGIDAAYKEFLTKGLGYKEPVHNRRRKFWLTDDAINLGLLSDDTLLELDGLSETERAAVILARVGQNNFRKALIKHWKGCALTGCKFITVLRASHIKPWKVSSSAERLDINNGILLNPNADTLFDLGLITFDEDGVLTCSDLLPKKERALLLPASPKIMQFNDKHQHYLAYHRKVVFRGGS